MNCFYIFYYQECKREKHKLINLFWVISWFSLRRKGTDCLRTKKIQYKTQRLYSLILMRPKVQLT